MRKPTGKSLLGLLFNSFLSLVAKDNKPYVKRMFLSRSSYSLVLMGALVGLLGGGQSAFADPPACRPYHCWCISTHRASQSGFGGPRGNIAIQIRAIDPRVTRISVTNAYTGQVFFSGMPYVGQTIRVNAKMTTIATAPRIGLMCGVHYWVIDYKGRPH
jgi:hypothetical protein